MRDRLFVAVLGNRNSGKSTTWNRLFEATVKTGKIQRSLHLNCAQTVDVFLINGSPQERGVNVKDVLVNPLPQIVLLNTTQM
jgi:septin family protein